MTEPVTKSCSQTLLIRAMGDNNDHYEGALLEEIRDDVRRLAEAVGGLSELPERVRVMDERLMGVEDDVKAIKAAVTDMNADLRDHEHRITHLERAA